MCSALSQWFPGGGGSLGEGNYPSVVQGFADIGNITEFHLPVYLLPACTPGTFNTYGTGIGENLGKHAFFHGLCCRHIIHIKLGVPEIAYILYRIYAAAKACIEYMEHGHHVCKISLVVAHKKYVVLREGPDDFRPVYLQFVKSLISLMGHDPHNADQPFLQEKDMPKRISFE